MTEQPRRPAMSEQNGWQAVKHNGSMGKHVYAVNDEDAAWVGFARDLGVEIQYLRNGWRMEPVTITPRRVDAKPTMECDCCAGGSCYAKVNAAAEAVEGGAVAWQRLHPVHGWVDALPETVEHYRRMGMEVRPLYTAPITTPAAPAAPGAEALHGPTIEACARLCEGQTEGYADLAVLNAVRSCAEAVRALATPPATSASGAKTLRESVQREIDDMREALKFSPFWNDDTRPDFERTFALIERALAIPPAAQE